MTESKKRSSERSPAPARGRAEESDARAKAHSALVGELAAVKARLERLEAAHAHCDERMRELQDRNMSLVQLTVASQLLCGGGEREEVLNAIEDIIINMIGSEEIAIFALSDSDGAVRLVRSRGIERTSPRLPRALAPVREALATGRVVIPSGGDITAVIPLNVDSTSFGAITVFRLLEQKPALDPLDHELFDLLRRQGAVAIFSTSFRSLKPTVRPPRGGAS